MSTVIQKLKKKNRKTEEKLKLQSNIYGRSTEVEGIEVENITFICVFMKI